MRHGLFYLPTSFRRRHLDYGHVRYSDPNRIQPALRIQSAMPAFYSSTRIILRHALHNNSLLRLPVAPVHKFHATSFLGATHRTSPHARRDWRPPGPFQRLIRRFNVIPRSYIIFGILGINGVVFAAWSYVQLFQVRLPLVPQVRRAFAAHSAQGPTNRYITVPPSARWVARWLQDNFINSHENLRRGRLYVSSPLQLFPECPDLYPPQPSPS